MNSKKKVMQSIRVEMQDALYAIDDKSKHQVMKITIGGEVKYYTLTFMNHDMYDSCVYSGKILDLDIDIQQDIQDIFTRIKTHSEYIRYAQRLGGTAVLHGKSGEDILLVHYGYIADIETYLLEKIPPLMERLK